MKECTMVIMFKTAYHKIVKMLDWINNHRIITTLGSIMILVSCITTVRSCTTSDYAKMAYDIVSKDLPTETLPEFKNYIKDRLREGYSHEDLAKYINSISYIYSQLDNEAELIINDEITGVSGNSHKFDIVIKKQFSIHDITIPIKLITLERPIELEEIKHLDSMFKDIQASKGIIFCNGGFTKETIEYAKKNFIDLCVLKDTDNIQNNRLIKIPAVWTFYKPNLQLYFNTLFEYGDTIYNTNLNRHFLSMDKGKTKFKIANFFADLWNNEMISYDTNGQKIEISLSDSIYIEIPNKETKTKNWKLAKDFKILYSVSEIYKVRYITPKKLKAVENILTSDIEFTDLEVEFALQSDDWEFIDNPGTIVDKGLVIVISSALSKIEPEDINIEFFYISLEYP